MYSGIDFETSALVCHHCVFLLLQFHLQSVGQQPTQQQQQPPVAHQHQLPGPGPSVSFAPEAEASAEPETSKKSKRGPVWKRRHLVIEQINELIEELDEIDSNIALQVGLPLHLLVCPAS